MLTIKDTFPRGTYRPAKSASLVGTPEFAGPFTVSQSAISGNRNLRIIKRAQRSAAVSIKHKKTPIIAWDAIIGVGLLLHDLSAGIGLVPVRHHLYQVAVSNGP